MVYLELDKNDKKEKIIFSPLALLGYSGLHLFVSAMNLFHLFQKCI